MNDFSASSSWILEIFEVSSPHNGKRRRPDRAWLSDAADFARAMACQANAVTAAIIGADEENLFARDSTRCMIMEDHDTDRTRIARAG